MQHQPISIEDRDSTARNGEKFCVDAAFMAFKPYQADVFTQHFYDDTFIIPENFTDVNISMPLVTSTIGAYPKPNYLEVPDWFKSRGGPDTFDPTSAYSDYMRNADDKIEALLVRAVREVITDQVDAGIDIPTDGEIRRDNYIHYHCRHLKGFDFDDLTEKRMRTGAWTARVPTIRSPVSAGAPFLVDEWRAAQACTDRPVKVTVPGPLTIMNSVADDFYHDEYQVGIALAEAVNTEVRALAEAGCRWIQVDEPLFARRPDKAVAYGMENLDRCFHNVPKETVRAMHMCCGYPAKLDQKDYLKADRSAYFTLADALEETSVQAVSIEDAHQHNDLTLLEHFKTIKVIFGAVSIAQSRIEPVEEIRDRLVAALEHTDPHRLIAAPDCGLGMQSRDNARAKLANLCAAAKTFP